MESTLLHPDLSMDRTGLAAAAHHVMDLLDGGPVAVVEAAVLLRQPVTIVTVLAADLARSGHVFVRTPPEDQQHDPELLERILHGLQCL